MAGCPSGVAVGVAGITLVGGDGENISAISSCLIVVFLCVLLSLRKSWAFSVFRWPVVCTAGGVLSAVWLG